MIKKRISKSQKFAKLKSDGSRLLYLLILPHLDVEGRLEADTVIIKGTVCPYIETLTGGIIAESLKELEKVGLIVLYKVNGEQYLELRRFDEFNRVDRKKESKSDIPANPASITPEQRQSTAGNTPAEYNPTPIEVKVKSNTKGKIGVVKKSSQEILELDCLIAKEREKFIAVIQEIFCPGNRSAATLAKITVYFIEQIQAGEKEVSLFEDATGWARHAKGTTAKNKIGLFVQKVNDETRFNGKGMLLDRERRRAHK